MQPRHIYLAGPIMGCDDSECRDWREQAKVLLAEHGCGTLDPLRRDYRGREHDPTLAAEIVEADLADLRECGGVLAYCDRPSTGTSMEVFYAAHVLKIPVVSVCCEGVSPWLAYHSWRVSSTLTQGVKQIAEQVRRLDAQAWARGLPDEGLRVAFHTQHPADYASAVMDEIARRYR